MTFWPFLWVGFKRTQTLRFQYIRDQLLGIQHGTEPVSSDKVKDLLIQMRRLMRDEWRRNPRGLIDWLNKASEV